jgi:hypothetical protein
MVYSDAHCVGDLDDMRPTESFAIFFVPILFLGVPENNLPKYKAVANAIAEVIWVEPLVRELGVSLQEKPCFWCDNLGATYLSANLVFMLAPNTLKLILILFVNELLASNLMFGLSLVRTRKLMVSPTHYVPVN